MLGIRQSASRRGVHKPQTLSDMEVSKNASVSYINAPWGQAENNPVVSLRGTQVSTPTYYLAGVSKGLLCQDVQLNPLIGQCLEWLKAGCGWFAIQATKRHD